MEEYPRAGEGETVEDRLQRLQADVWAAKPGHEAATFLAAIVESSDDAIISKSLQGIITTWNLRAERLFGYTAAEAVGRPITILIPEDRLDEEPAILARIHAGERVDHFETVRRRKDGTFIDISLTISPIRSSDGTIIGASKIARDISERKRAAERQDMLLREMHHRVKNLLAITGSIISLAARTAKTPLELADSMKNRLIALSRVHQLTLPSFSGEEASTKNPTTFHTLLENLLSPFEEKGARRWQFHGDNPHISADRATSLALLFHEYATNAVKYGAPSMADCRLDVTVTSEPGHLEIVWQESRASATIPGPPEKTGFGTTLEKMMVQSLHADVSREWRSQALLIKLTLPRNALAKA